MTAAVSETPSAPRLRSRRSWCRLRRLRQRLLSRIQPHCREHQVVAQSRRCQAAAKADYGWLAESLHRRIIELRHYPSTARLNGWEGKVVLKVSIRHDGQLKDVEVVKSSSHESLDQAAMEAVRRPALCT